MIGSEDFLLIPESESIIKPLPKPYERKIITEQELIYFIKTSPLRSTQPINTVNNNKQPIIIFGANWCPDCQILSAVLSLPSVKQYIDAHFSIMLVDLGRYDINMNLLEVVGIEQKDGVPRVIIFDRNRKAINLSTNDIWRTARDSSPQDIFNYFQSFKQDINN